MLSRRIMGVLALIVMASGAFAACGSSTFSEEDLVKDLTADGTFTEAQAQCIASGLKDADVPLDKFEDPSTEDMQKIQDVTIQCVAPDLGLDPADIPSTEAP